MMGLVTVILGLLLCTGNRIIVSTVAESDDLIKQNSCHDNDDNEQLELDNYSRFKNLPIIQTSFGNVRGNIEMFNEEEVLVFHGIRYAKPPVGALRFTKPVPVDSETIEMFGLQSAEKVGCIQPRSFLTAEDLVTSEDCLHLNVWVPLAKRSTKDINANQLPVMIWIHGGSFHLGTAHQDEFNGIVLSSFGQVIVVTLNYRLGFFGFLNAEHESASGNMGLYDQAAALRWVKENIGKFGGNPEAITVFGESAGGISVGLLSVSPLTRDLFQRAIIESGSPYSLLRPEPRASVFRKSLLFSKALNCSDQDDTDITESALECLRNVHYKVIDDYGGKEVMHSQILANPMLGDALIPHNVHVLMKSPENINKDVLIGMNKDEGFVFVYQQLRQLLVSSESEDLTKDEVHALLSKLLKGRPVDPLKAADYYFQNMTSNWGTTKVANTFFDLYGDLYINCPIYYLAKRFTEILGHDRVFSYVMTKASSQEYLPMCTDRSMVCHADELVLIFGVPLRQTELFNDLDRSISKHLMQLWTDFARTGKVNWTNHPNKWFVDLPLAEAQNFHPEKANACETFWRELFESQLN